jgi:alkylhydroperoxidase family enzyme
MTADSPIAPRPTRIKLVEPHEMTPEQRARYENDPMARTNLSRLLAIAETLAPRVTEFNVTMATATTLPPVEREIVALGTLHLERGEYEMAQHDVVAERLGIPRAKVDAIAQHRYNDPVFTEREKALLAFTRQVVKTVRVDDVVFNAVAAFYDRRQIVETVFVIGNYMMLARISEMAELPVDGTMGANFWKDRVPAS